MRGPKQIQLRSSEKRKREEETRNRSTSSLGHTGRRGQGTWKQTLGKSNILVVWIFHFSEIKVLPKWKNSIVSKETTGVTEKDTPFRTRRDTQIHLLYRILNMVIQTHFIQSWYTSSCV